MHWSGINVFHTKPGKYKEKKCVACGSVCFVERNRMGATCFGEAMAHKQSLHDCFYCPYSDKEWHDRVIELLQEEQDTKSLSIAKVIKEERLQALKAGLEGVERKVKTTTDQERLEHIKANFPGENPLDDVKFLLPLAEAYLDSQKCPCDGTLDGITCCYCGKELKEKDGNV